MSVFKTWDRMKCLYINGPWINFIEAGGDDHDIFINTSKIYKFIEMYSWKYINLFISNNGSNDLAFCVNYNCHTNV
jgi:hypothetical protein